MDDKYILSVAESKAKYHKAKAKIPYEKKINIIIALQKIDIEFHKKMHRTSSKAYKKKAWQLKEDDNI